MALPEMTAGGAWMSRSPDVPPAYVVGEDAIARHLRDGWIIIEDPREDPDAEETGEDSSEDAPAPKRSKTKKRGNA